MCRSQGKKTLSGKELAEEGLRLVAEAVAAGAIRLEKGRVSDDIFVHADSPNGNPRVTYVLLDPDDHSQVIARCAFNLTGQQLGLPVYQIDWAVLRDHRARGLGYLVASKAFAEFCCGLIDHMEEGFFIEAVVDASNPASIKVARKVIGNEQVLDDQERGAQVHSFVRRIECVANYSDREKRLGLVGLTPEEKREKITSELDRLAEARKGLVFPPSSREQAAQKQAAGSRFFAPGTLASAANASAAPNILHSAENGDAGAQHPVVALVKCTDCNGDGGRIGDVVFDTDYPEMESQTAFIVCEKCDGTGHHRDRREGG